MSVWIRILSDKELMEADISSERFRTVEEFGTFLFTSAMLQLNTNTEPPSGLEIVL